MKARVKATGEIVEIENYDIDKLGKLKYFTKDFDVYDEDEVEIILERDPDYWARLEHQYAGMAMQGMVSNSEMFIELGNAKGLSVENAIAEASLKIAHALVEKLKNQSV